MMRRMMLTAGVLFAAAIVIAGCAKKGAYQLRPAHTAEIGMQAICPVTSNVFIVSKETMAVDYHGKTYYLCCPDCSGAFEKKLGVMTSHAGHDGDTKGMKDMPAAAAPDKEIIYWTCPMHPQVKKQGPGQCPICGMDLVPVYKKEGNRIAVDQSTGKLLGLTSTAARMMQVNKTVRLPARVAYDNDLYLSQQEYLLSYKNFNGQGDILAAARFRLTLLGYTDNDIKELEKQGQPDTSLLIPGDTAWLFADVYENDLQSVTPGKEVAAISGTYPGTTFNGNIMFVEPALNPATRSAKARIKVTNTQHLLKLEMFVTIEIKTARGNILAVPKTAVIDTGTRTVVYVDYGTGEYEPRDVTTGFAGDDTVEIRKGLSPGDLVVTNGNFMLDSESQLRGSPVATDTMPGMDMGSKK